MKGLKVSSDDVRDCNGDFAASSAGRPGDLLLCSRVSALLVSPWVISHGGFRSRGVQVRPSSVEEIRPSSVRLSPRPRRFVLSSLPSETAN